MDRQPPDYRARFDALYAAAHDRGDLAAGLELAGMLVRMRAKQQHPGIDRAWEAALSVPWDRPDRLVPAALAYLALHPTVQRALADPADAAALPHAVVHLSGLRLFHLAVSSAVVTPQPWRNLFLRWRALALQRRLSGHGVGPGIGWIAVQAHLAQYLWPLDAGQDGLDVLRRRAAADAAEAADADAADDAMLLACFEHPGAEAQFALDDTSPAGRMLLQRLYREPADELANAQGLLARAGQALPQGAQRGQYERYPYPNWTTEPLLPAAIPAAAQAHLIASRWWRRRKVLLAGCGTGLQCVSARATYADAAITAIDFSATSLAYAVRKCREAGLRDITFEAADLLAFPGRGQRYDVVECIGVLHHLTDLDAGAAALRALTRPGGLLRLAVYSAHARQHVRELRAMIAGRKLDGSLASLRQVHAELLAGVHGAVSPSLLESPDLHSASGLHDLLFNACEHTLGAQDWASLLARHGFGLVCMDPPAATAQAAGPGSSAWSPAQWEDYERAHPSAFASMYEFWFAALE